MDLLAVQRPRTCVDISDLDELLISERRPFRRSPRGCGNYGGQV